MKLCVNGFIFCMMIELMYRKRVLQERGNGGMNI